MKVAVESLLDLCRNKNLRLATAESCTGGMLAAAITAIAGSSDVFERGYVTYSNRSKRELLGVPSSMLLQHGAVSEPVAIAMAEGTLLRSKVDFAVSITGIAGPGSAEHKPEGQVCFALATKIAPAIAETVQFGAVGRSQVRSNSVLHAVKLLGVAAQDIY